MNTHVVILFSLGTAKQSHLLNIGCNEHNIHTAKAHLCQGKEGIQHPASCTGKPSEGSWAGGECMVANISIIHSSNAHPLLQLMSTSHLEKLKKKEGS